MKVFLAFDHLGINHEAMNKYFGQAVDNLGWQRSTVEKCDFTIMWGPNQEFEQTRERGKPVLMVDFPYWNRGGKIREGNEYYKISLNGQHPTKYIFTEKFGPMRYKATNGPEIKPWKKEGGTHIVLAGMGIKAAGQYGYGLGDWEQRAADKIKRQIDIPIYYRPKPRQRPVPIIGGTISDSTDRDIDHILDGAYCLVCHHGNPTVTALAMGIPIVMNGPIGVASHLAQQDWNKIKDRVFMDNRQQFFNNLSYWQWSVQEIISGVALKSYFDRGLIG